MAAPKWCGACYPSVTLHDNRWNRAYGGPNGGSGLPSSGQLIDFVTGSGTGVTLTVTGGAFDGSSHATQLSGAPASGTDAYNVFNGKLTAFGSLSYQEIAAPAGNLVLTFTGLNPNKLYELVF